MKKIYYIISIAILILLLIIISNSTPVDNPSPISRQDAVPSSSIKMAPENDDHPPILYSDEFSKPVPVTGFVNTAGAEDSPFIPYGKDEMYFFFTPDTDVPVEQQISDGATGIYISYGDGKSWSGSYRVTLQDKNKLSLDGCEFVSENEIWFCSAREGYPGLNWFKANKENNKWTNWEKLNFPENYEIGELHLYGNELYYHSSKIGGEGGLDIWKTEKINNQWVNPENIEQINSPENEGWPYITSDGNELWFTRTYMGTPAIFRSKKLDGEWQIPELIISQFAGEPTMDSRGNLYFVHHYYKNGKMIEADIYVAKKK